MYADNEHFQRELRLVESVSAFLWFFFRLSMVKSSHWSLERSKRQLS
jgi:hypothetical protein